MNCLEFLGDNEISHAVICPETIFIDKQK